MSPTQLHLLVLDTETTGFVPRTHRVIEFACCEISNGKAVREYEQLLSINEDIPPHVQVLTQIKPQDLQGKPKFADILPVIQKKLTPGTIIVGQNIAFDIKMLKGEGLDLTEHACIDTAMLASIVFPELASYSLGYMSEVLSLTHEPKHRALGDVHATAELLGKCTDRLTELTPAQLEAIQKLAERAPEGYKRFFASLSAKGKSSPSWIAGLQTTSAVTQVSPLTLPDAKPGSLALLEESLDPQFLSRVVATALKAKHSTWIAVKNLEATLRRIVAPSDVTVIYPPELLLNPSAADTLLKQKTLTADEFTLATKLTLYPTVTRADIPVHADEQAVWNGKLAVVRDDSAYTKQFSALKPVRLIDHQELLRILTLEKSPVIKGDHIIIDDASMLEDTATYAYGWNCPIAALRASASENALLTKCVDLLELWIERVRGGTDLRYITNFDLQSRDSEGLRDCIDAALKSELLVQSRSALEQLRLIFDPNNLAGRIVWSEVFQDGSRHLKSVPEDIASLLAERLYKPFATTLIVPSGGIALKAIIPVGIQPVLTKTDALVQIAVDLPEAALTSFLHGLQGKCVLLASSKRIIEDIYVRQFHALEEAGTTLICQGFCGGQNRMQAEFAEAKAPAALVVTPWSYETFELPAKTVDKLVIQALPFDHPSHAVIGRRAAHFGDPFNEYSLPRLLHRVFRLLRTFSRHRTDSASVAVLDDRIATKGYGKDVVAFLRQFAQGSAPTVHTPPKKAPTKKKGDAGQMSLL